MTETLLSIHDTIGLPWWGVLIAALFVALSPLVIKKWRRSADWHR
jgi:hypothetical protein